MELTGDDVIQIMKILEESKFSELNLQMDGLKIIVRKNSSGPSPRTVYPKARVDSIEGTPSLSRSPLSPDIPMETPPAEDRSFVEKDGIIPIKAPILGTFYRSHKPGAKPFVEVGQFVSAEDTVCIIEVMKLFSTIKAGLTGTIVKILAEDGELVEFNQPLFLVEPGPDGRDSPVR